MTEHLPCICSIDLTYIDIDGVYQFRAGAAIDSYDKECSNYDQADLRNLSNTQPEDHKRYPRNWRDWPEESNNGIKYRVNPFIPAHGNADGSAADYGNCQCDQHPRKAGSNVPPYGDFGDGLVEQLDESLDRLKRGWEEVGEPIRYQHPHGEQEKN